MGATIDNTKYDLHNWIMRNQQTYKDISIKVGNDEALIYDAYLNSTQRQLDRLIKEKNLAIENYLKKDCDNYDLYLEFIIEVNNHIKQLLGL
jgi:hypothetical protein